MQHLSYHALWAKVIFSDESGQNINLVKLIYYDGRSHTKSGQHFRFSKMSTYFEYLPFEIPLLDFSVHVHFYFQNGHVMTSAANQM